MIKNLPSVVIVGRPNVGKSTLFNRLLSKRISITNNEAGTTRDRLIQECEWLDKRFHLIDTGGYSKDISQINFQEDINQQIMIALQEADLVLFVVSAKSGLQVQDKEIATILRNKIKKDVIIVANKMDDKNMETNIYEFSEFGFGTPIGISSIHSIGVGKLLDKIIEKINFNISMIDDLQVKSIGIIGKTNVGKSTFINNLVNDERLIVSNTPGTTRDAVDININFNKKDYVITDTAGLIKNKKTLDDTGWYSELRTNITIKKSDFIFAFINYEKDLSRIDRNIISTLIEEKKPFIIVVNKSDLLNMEERNIYIKTIHTDLKFATHIPIEFISSIKKKNFIKLFDQIKTIFDQMNQNVKQEELNRFLVDLLLMKYPQRHNGLEIKLTRLMYNKKNVPTFIFYTNYPEFIHFSYKRFIENNIRNVLGFKNCPINLIFIKS